MGKVLIVNALVGSLFVYKMSVLLNMSSKITEKFYDLVLAFVRGEVKPKIPINILMLPKEHG